jgi:hypothetical protein
MAMAMELFSRKTSLTTIDLSVEKDLLYLIKENGKLWPQKVLYYWIYFIYVDVTQIQIQIFYLFVCSFSDKTNIIAKEHSDKN